MAGSTLTGFYQPVFFEAYAGQAEVTGSSFNPSPAEYGGSEYPPVGVMLLSDGSAQMNATMAGPFTISGNTFSGYSCYGVIAQAGDAAASLTGSLSDVSLTGNTFDLPAVLDPGSSALTSPIVLTTDDTGDQLSQVQVTGNSLTTSGSGAGEITVNGSTATNITDVDVSGNDWLAGPSVVGLDNGSGSPVAAVGNYWGDPTGPAGRAPDRAPRPQRGWTSPVGVQLQPPRAPQSRLLRPPSSPVTPPARPRSPGPYRPLMAINRSPATPSPRRTRPTTRPGRRSPCPPASCQRW